MSMSTARRLVAAIERAYDFDLDTHAWLKGLVVKVSDTFAPGPSIALEYDTAAPPGSLFADWTAIGISPAEETWVRRLLDSPRFRGAATASLRPLDRIPPAARLSELMGFSLSRSPFQPFAARYGFADVLALNACDGTSRGVFLALRSHATGDNGFQRGRAVLPHVTAALRIRRGIAAHREQTTALPGAPHGAEAVLDPSGIVRDGAVSATDREVLRHAVLERDRLRLTRTDPDETLDAWTALIAGRWSLVDVFERNGKRFVVAVPNLPNVRDPRGLPPLARAVFGLLVRGRSNKAIGFELGISEGTAAGYIREIRKKLGAETIRAAAAGPNARSFRVSIGRENLMAIVSDQVRALPEGHGVSAAEQRVVELLIAGRTNQEIATERGVSASTVAKQIASAYEKLGVGSRRELRAALRV